MNRRIIIALILIALLGGYLIYRTEANKDSLVTSPTNRGTVVTGTVTAVDRDQLMVDGPTIITMVTTEGSSEVVAVPSMGINLCEAADNIADVAQLAVGDTVTVSGSREEGGVIVPCTESEDRLMVIGKAVDSTFGYEFSYRKGPDGYITLEDSESTHPDFVTGLMLFSADEYDEFVLSKDAREGPPAMRLRVYENPKKLFPAVWTLYNQQEVNYHLKLGEESETVVGGANAVHFTTDGLYTTDVHVIANDSRIYVLTGDSFGSDSTTIKQDFIDLVNSFTFVPSTIPVGGGAKIDPRVACESALAYMSFPSSVEADAFVSDCVAGKHREVIERFIRESGFDGATI